MNTSNNSSHSRNKTMTIEYTIHGFILDGNLRKETASLFEMFNAFDQIESSHKFDFFFMCAKHVKRYYYSITTAAFEFIYVQFGQPKEYM